MCPRHILMQLKEPSIAQSSAYTLASKKTGPTFRHKESEVCPRRRRRTPDSFLSRFYPVKSRSRTRMHARASLSIAGVVRTCYPFARARAHVKEFA